MAETTMEPWSFTIVFDEDKAKKNGYEVENALECLDLRSTDTFHFMASPSKPS